MYTTCMSGLMSGSLVPRKQHNMKLQERLMVLEVVQKHKQTFKTREEAQAFVDFKASIKPDEAEVLLMEIKEENGLMMWKDNKDPDKSIEIPEWFSTAVENYKNDCEKNGWSEYALTIVSYCENLV